MNFRYTSHVGRDDHGHGHPAPPHEATRTLTWVRPSASIDGYCVCGSADTAAVANRMIRGMNPLDRGAIWYRLLEGQWLERRAHSQHPAAAVALVVGPLITDA